MFDGPLLLQVNLPVVDTIHPWQKVTRLLLVWRTRLQVNQNLIRAQREQSKLLKFLWFSNNTGTLIKIIYTNLLLVVKKHQLSNIGFTQCIKSKYMQWLLKIMYLNNFFWCSNFTLSLN